MRDVTTTLREASQSQIRHPRARLTAYRKTPSFQPPTGLEPTEVNQYDYLRSGDLYHHQVWAAPGSIPNLFYRQDFGTWEELAGPSVWYGVPPGAIERGMGVREMFSPFSLIQNGTDIRLVYRDNGSGQLKLIEKPQDGGSWGAVSGTGTYPGDQTDYVAIAMVSATVGYLYRYTANTCYLYRITISGSAFTYTLLSAPGFPLGIVTAGGGLAVFPRSFHAWAFPDRDAIFFYIYGDGELNPAAGPIALGDEGLYVAYYRDGYATAVRPAMMNPSVDPAMLDSRIGKPYPIVDGGDDLFLPLYRAYRDGDLDSPLPTISHTTFLMSRDGLHWRRGDFISSPGVKGGAMTRISPSTLRLVHGDRVVDGTITDFYFPGQEGEDITAEVLELTLDYPHGSSESGNLTLSNPNGETLTNPLLAEGTEIGMELGYWSEDVGEELVGTGYFMVDQVSAPISAQDRPVTVQLLGPSSLLKADVEYDYNFASPQLIRNGSPTGQYPEESCWNYDDILGRLAAQAGVIYTPEYKFTGDNPELTDLRIYSGDWEQAPPLVCNTTPGVLRIPSPVTAYDTAVNLEFSFEIDWASGYHGGILITDVGTGAGNKIRITDGAIEWGSDIFALPVTLQTGTWYVVRVVKLDTYVLVFINGRNVLTVKDAFDPSTPVAPGLFSDSGVAGFRNIRWPSMDMGILDDWVLEEGETVSSNLDRVLVPDLNHLTYFVDADRALRVFRQLPGTPAETYEDILLSLTPTRSGRVAVNWVRLLGADTFVDYIDPTSARERGLIFRKVDSPYIWGRANCLQAAADYIRFGEEWAEQRDFLGACSPYLEREDVIRVVNTQSGTDGIYVINNLKFRARVGEDEVTLDMVVGCRLYVAPVNATEAVDG